MFIDFREKQEVGGGGRERNIHPCERETSINYLLYVPQPGIEPVT